MEAVQQRTLLIALRVAVFASTILLLGGVGFAAKNFGFRGAMSLFLLLALPLVVAVRLHGRWPSLRRRELLFFAIVLCAAVGSSVFVLRAWYADGLDSYHAEDMQWAEFARRFRQDPAFRDVRDHKSERKNIHWASGAVDSEADLIRLHALAAECGIHRQRLDGPFVHSVSFTVRERGDLQGTWKVMSWEQDGKGVDVKSRYNKVVITDGKYVGYLNDGIKTFFTLKLDGSKQPKQIDFTHPEEKEPFFGIYSLEGNRLTLSWDGFRPGQRPTTFTGAGTKVFIHLERLNAPNPSP